MQVTITLINFLLSGVIAIISEIFSIDQFSGIYQKILLKDRIQEFVLIFVFNNAPIWDSQYGK